MKYVKMTIAEAIKYTKGDKSKVVLVSVQDLEKDELPEFVKKSKSECESIINQAETVARVYDDFVNQLRVFTEEQIDIRNIKPSGSLSTILLRDTIEQKNEQTFY